MYVYAGAMAIFLDDVLAACDAHTGAAIWYAKKRMDVCVHSYIYTYICIYICV